MDNALAPGLLLAAPTLGDPNFDRTVVLLGEHDDEGTLGWVLNGKAFLTAAQLLREAGLLDNNRPVPPGMTVAAASSPVRYGGPVMPGSVWLLFERDEAVPSLPGQLELDARHAITGARDAIVSVAGSGSTPPRFRFLVGYAGWGPGQLEHEIQHGAWLPASLDADLLFEPDVDSLWDSAYHRATGTSPAAFRGGGGSRGQA